MSSLSADDFPSRFATSSAYHLAKGTWPMHALWHVELDVERDLAGPAAARREVRRHLGPLLTRVELDDILLLLSELLTNAIRHPIDGNPHVSVRLSVAAACVRAEINDGGPGFDPLAVAGPSDEGGYGLFILDRASSRWGASRSEGHCVWFELDRDARAA